jgi:tetratricopeptide (TPR) repeat protein
MREALSRSHRTKSKGKIRVASKATGSKSVPRARTKSPTSTRLKSAKKRLLKKTVKAKPKTTRSVKKAARIKRAIAKSTKTSAKKIKRVDKSKKITTRKKAKTLSKAYPKSRVAKVAKARAIPKVKKATRLHRATKVRGVARGTGGAGAARATKVRTKGKGKVSLVVRRATQLPKVPLLPPEPPRRQVSSAVLRAFEQAVKVFNRRQYAEAKGMFENLQSRFPNEVEIISRAQTYIQVCSQKLAHTPSLPRNADELYDRGVFALNIGDFTQARSFFEKALRLRPDEPHLLYSLAATHAQTGSHDQAIDYLRRSIQIQPRFRAQALNDMDFSDLRENKQFLELLGLTSPFERLDSRR